MLLFDVIAQDPVQRLESPFGERCEVFRVNTFDLRYFEEADMDVGGSQADPGLDLSLVIPLYNEYESVAPLLAAIEDALGDHRAQPHLISMNKKTLRYEVVLVDDGSTDSTYNEAVKCAHESSAKVRVVSLQRNFGQSAAMQAGIDAATGRLIATLDGDLQNDPSDIPKMVQHLEENDLDLLVGRRKKRQDGMFLRLIPSWIANRLIGKVTGVKIHDYGCSLKIYRADVIRQVRLLGEMHRFIPAWTAAITNPSRIGEIDVKHHARQFGTSKYGISRTVRVVLDLLAVSFFMKYRARPGHFFGTVGLVVGAVGAAMLSLTFLSKFAFGNDIGSRPMLLLGSLAVLSSLQLICFGIMAEMLSRNNLESKHNATYFVRRSVTNHLHSTPATLPLERSA
ncbi:MAG: glycosyltransferase family 2 protein [Pirellulaceae bacterium]